MSVRSTTPLFVSASDPRLRWIGRVQASDSAVRFAWSGSGFAARFFGTGFGCVLRDPVNRFTIVVNGVALPESFWPGSASEHTLISGLPLGEHTLQLLRRSEPLFGPSELAAIWVEGEQLLEAPPATRTIEVLGDSISCGYGNETDHPSVPFTAETENHFRGYAALLARAVDAEVSTLAWSGRGVVRNYADAPEPLMPELYQRTLPELQNVQWTFEDDVALVIVHLGTNDFTTPGPDPDLFIAGYVSLLATIRQRRPNAPILCCIGPMLAPLTQKKARAAIERAVAVRRAAGDENITYYAVQTPNREPGSDEHPSLTTHATMAAELVPVVRKLLRMESNAQSRTQRSPSANVATLEPR